MREVMCQEVIGGGCTLCYAECKMPSVQCTKLQLRCASHSRYCTKCNMLNAKCNIATKVWVLIIQSTMCNMPFANFQPAESQFWNAQSKSNKNVQPVECLSQFCNVQSKSVQPGSAFPSPAPCAPLSLSSSAQRWYTDRLLINVMKNMKTVTFAKGANWRVQTSAKEGLWEERGRDLCSS